MSRPVTNARWLSELFKAQVRDDVFGGHLPQDRPLVVLLGGPPGSGKSWAQSMIATRNQSRDLVPITGDELRSYHPDYIPLIRSEPMEMPAVTAPVSGALVRLCLEWALKNNYSVLLEGTFRDTRMVSETARRFGQAGYDIEVVAVAVPASVSRLSAEARFLQAHTPLAARWTPPEVHAAALHAAPTSLEALRRSSIVGRIEVMTRESVVYRDTRALDGRWRTSVSPGSIMRNIQSRHPTGAIAREWLHSYHSVFTRASAREHYLTPQTIEAYRLLQQDAAIIISQTGLLNDERASQEREQRRRGKILADYFQRFA